MATYTKAMNPDSMEYHTAQANTAHAIIMAKIYSGETISLEVTTANDTVMQEDPSTNANTNTNQPDTITDDVPFLEITGEEEIAQL